ncbi:transglutaminase-like cysteine peptidase [Brevundimonas sp.]|uniref:transglutaminase-like cysteine peptidase n=1 Tax=Brevundimonas sp. TaxID=1871086 RepID=UPI002FC66967
MRQGFRITVFAAAAMLCAALPASAHDAEAALDLAFASTGGGTAMVAPRWAAMTARMAAEDAAPRPAAPACKPAAKTTAPGCQAAEWSRKLDKLSARPDVRQLKAVNRQVNALTYVADTDNWAQADYWATPREMLERGGDCEDFATAKYFALRQLGFAAADLRIAVVWDSVDREQHAVLLARAGERTLVLDNKRADLTPLAAVADRYQLLYALDDGRIALPLQLAAAEQPGAPQRTRNRIVNGGRTLVMQIQPRRRLPGATPPAAPFEMALAETSAPAGR